MPLPHRELRIVAARFFLGQVTTNQLIDVAHAVLDGGVYAYGLGEIATSRDPRLSDLGPLFESALKDLNAQVTSWDEAIDILTERYMLTLAEEPTAPAQIVREVYHGVYHPLLFDDRMKRREQESFGALANLVDLYYQYGYPGDPASFERLDRGCINLAKRWCRDRWFHLLDPVWLTSTVLALAQGIYDERAFDRMPILADALQDAGCENADILDHCRDPKATHLRGCWVVDLVLGKE